MDPLADAQNLVSYSPYHYTYNNPITFVDPDGRMPVQAEPGDPPSWAQSIKQGFTDLGNSIKEYFDFGSLVTGTQNENAQTLSRVHGVANAANEIKNNALDVVEGGAQTVGAAADFVEGAALTTTALTGGASSPVTLPIAGAAEVVGDVALGVEVGVDYARDGKVDQTVGDLAYKAVFVVSGKAIDKGVDVMKIGGSDSRQTRDAVKSIGQGVNKVTEEAIKNRKK